MGVELVQFDKKTVQAVDDREIYDFMTPANGIIYGCEVTILNSNTLHITNGYGMIKGSKFNITEENIQIELASWNEENGRLTLRLDLGNTDKPIELKVDKNPDSLERNSNVNENNGVFEIELASFTITSSQIKNLKTKSKRRSTEEMIMLIYQILHDNVVFRDDMDISYNNNFKEEMSTK